MRALWLVGMMGSGKTSVGKALAGRTGLPLFDTDEMIAADRGVTVASIWETNGETVFRDLETGQVEGIVAAAHRCVVATGGGVVMRASNVAAMRSNGLVVWLNAAVDELASRITDDGTRPLLLDVPVSRRLDDLLARRAPAYAAAAHHVVDTSGRTVDEVADEVMALWTPS